MKIAIMLLLSVSLVMLAHAYFNHERLSSKYCIFVQNLQLILLPIALYMLTSSPKVIRDDLGEWHKSLLLISYMLSIIFVFVASAILVIRVSNFVAARAGELLHKGNDAVIFKINKLFQ